MCQIGKGFVVDPTLEEELCTDARITVAINTSGNLCTIQKGGKQSGLDPKQLHAMLEVRN